MQENGFAANQMDVFKVPGSLEIPLVGQQCLQNGYDLAVGIGFVVNGLIYRHEFVGQEVVRGIVDVSLRTNKPFLSVVLTPQAYQEHLDENTDFFVHHMVTKGKEAASAALQMLDLQVGKKAA
jgi:6,7-dimethyl-8-ribityllumazine synthase